MISCKESTRRMSQDMDQPLDWRTRLGLRLHLLFCSGCRRTRSQFQFLRNAIRRHPWGDE